MNAKRLFIVIAPLAILAAVWYYWLRVSAPPAEGARTSASSFASQDRVPPQPSPDAKSDDGRIAQEEPSHLVDDLNSARTDIKSDLRILNEVFVTYRSSTHQEDPIGENAEITAVLTGRNNLGFAFVPRDSPAVNSKGELCDRWGTPFFFHQVSGTEMEIRSAGPDRKLWTGDDIVMTP